MQDYILPTFDELISSGVTSAFNTSERSCSVIRPAVKPQKLKVAAYCRVSTDHEEQQSSIRIQRQHFATVASKHSDWEFVGIYADIVSGTKKEKRPELMRLLSDCAAGDVNLVLTKSVSRFARNTTDLLEMVRSLTSNGTDIYFERENIDTRTMDSEFLLTILASLAEDESHSIASNCRWGLQKRFQDGSYRAASAPYGYDLVDGNYAVNETEAKIVREIFTLAAEGTSNRAIADELNLRAIPTKRAGQVWKGKEISGIWNGGHIHRILKNEAYIGRQTLQKTFSDSSFQRRINHGELPKYCLDDHHPAIIDRVTFDAVQEIMEKRKNGPCGVRTSSVFSGIMYCGHCGSPMQKLTNKVGNVFLVCRKHRHRASDCGLPNIPESTIKSQFESLMRSLAADDAPLQTYLREISDAHYNVNKDRLDHLEARLAEVNKSQTKQLHLKTRGSISGAEFLERQNSLKIEEAELQIELSKITDNRIQLTEELLKHVHESHSRCGSFVFEENTFKALVESITAYGKDDLVFHFRCGFEYRIYRLEEA